MGKIKEIEQKLTEITQGKWRSTDVPPYGWRVETDDETICSHAWKDDSEFIADAPKTIRWLVNRLRNVERIRRAFIEANAQRHHAQHRADDLAGQRNRIQAGFLDMQRKRNEAEAKCKKLENQNELLRLGSISKNEYAMALLIIQYMHKRYQHDECLKMFEHFMQMSIASNVDQQTAKLCKTLLNAAHDNKYIFGDEWIDLVLVYTGVSLDALSNQTITGEG